MKDKLHVERDGAECYVTTSNALERLCTMSRPKARQRLADARMIVRQCNLNGELVAALRSLLAVSACRTMSFCRGRGAVQSPATFLGWGNYPGRPCDCCVCEAARAALVIIAAAEMEPS